MGRLQCPSIEWTSPCDGEEEEDLLLYSLHFSDIYHHIHKEHSSSCLIFVKYIDFSCTCWDLGSLLIWGLDRWRRVVCASGVSFGLFLQSFNGGVLMSLSLSWTNGSFRSVFLSFLVFLWSGFHWFHVTFSGFSPFGFHFSYCCLLNSGFYRFCLIVFSWFVYLRFWVFFFFGHYSQLPLAPGILFKNANLCMKVEEKMSGTKIPTENQTILVSW